MISALIILSFLIFFHELGHFLMAKLVGVNVEVFSIGFGKKIICKKFGETNWCLSAVPLGGYVQMKGQDDTDPLKSSNDSDSFTSKSPWQKILILLGGPGFNFLLAILIYFFIALTGWQKLAPVIGKTIPNTPANSVLKTNDEILQINSHPVKTWDEIPQYILKSSIIDLTVKRKNEILNIELKPKIEIIKNIFGEKIKRKIIGIIPSGKTIKVHYTFLKAVCVASNKFISDSTLIVKGVEKLITGSIGLNTISGPIGIVDVTAKIANYGIVPLLLLTALLSVNLGILNLLPIPALDGGHIVFNLYEAVFKRKLNENIMIKLTVAGWTILGLLMAIGIFNDISRLIGG